MPDKLTPIKLIDDQPIFGDEGRPDLLDVTAFAKTLAGVALGTQGPFNIGVYGGWGVGKTSMLRYVKHLVDTQTKSQEDVLTVWFDPWQFECEDHPVFALIAAIVRALPPSATGWLGEVGKALQSMAYACSFEVGVTGAKANLDASKAMDKAKELAEGPLGGKIAYQEAFDLLGRCSKSVGKGRIVVFIDDLDRCQPGTALKLLESMKLVFGQRGFIFFLAVDNSIIEGYLTHSYKQELDLATSSDRQTDAPYRYLAGRYLHKLVQMDFPLPSHIPDRFNAYLGELTKEDVSDATQREELVTILRLGAAANPRSAVRQINRLRVQYNLWKLMEMGAPGGVTEEQIPLLMAFSNVMLDRLGPRPFEQLVDDEEACVSLAALKPPGEEEAEEPLSDSARQVVEPLRKEHKALKPLLTGEIAQLWLGNGDLRKAIHTFFQKTEVISAVPEAQQVIVDRVIRGEIRGLSPDAPIPDQKLKEVARLVLTGQTDFNDTGMTLITDMPNLTELWLSNTQVSDAGLVHLKALTGLQQLDLQDTQVSDAGLARLIDLTSLEGLDLRGTQVSDAGLVHLKDLTSLQWLNLDGTQVSDAGLAHLNDLTDLKSLHLGRTQVSDAGLAHLNDLTSLQWLNLDRTQVSDAGLAHLKDLTSLQWLYLSGTRVSDAGLAHLKGLTSLMRLCIQGTQVSEAGVAALMKQLPGCIIER